MLRNFMRKVGEKILWAMPLVGMLREDSSAEVITTRNGLLGVHNAVSMNGEAAVFTVTSAGASWAIPLGLSGLIRVVVDDSADVYARIDDPAAVAADPTIADSITTNLQGGSTTLMELRDPTVANHLSMKTLAGTTCRVWVKVMRP